MSPKKTNKVHYKIVEGGVTLGDFVYLTPTQGKSQRFGLNRTEIKFELSNKLTKENYGTKWMLPDPVNDGEFSLKLESFYSASNGKRVDRFVLKALSGSFQLNGNWVQSAFVSKGDEVLLGYNILKFLESRTGSKERLEPLFSPACKKGHSLNRLILGETGTGKSTFAEEIHRKSGKTGRFVALNLSSFSPSLIESEIFGHVKGGGHS